MPKHLLFDFGVVLIPIDQSLTYEAFEKLGAREELALQNELFEKVERGDLDNDTFLKDLQPFFFRKNIFKKDLARAWNAMCYEPIPEENIQLLKKLKREHRLFLLSNTNGLHIQKIKALTGPFKYAQFRSLFEAIYYSHEMGCRKPEAAFFEKVLKEQDLKAEECLFIDDRAENIEAAEKLGIKSWLFNPKEDDLKELIKKTAQ